jgi:hypothetical protein
MGSAEGVLKGAAARIGITVEEYKALRAQGFKWCMACTGWRLVDDFATDRSRGDGRKSTCSRHYVRTISGPTKLERRQQALLGQRWCRGCAAWLPTEDVSRQGACRPCTAAQARANYAGPAGAQIRARVYARKRGLDPIPPWWREAHIEDFGGVCAYGCGAVAQVLDHIWPVARGGQSTPGNLAPACPTCNGKKSDKNPTPWVERGLMAVPVPWERLVALSLEHNTDRWLEEIFNG